MFSYIKKQLNFVGGVWFFYYLFIKFNMEEWFFHQDWYGKYYYYFIFIIKIIYIYIYIILKYGKHQNNLITMERSNDTIWNNQNIENLFEIWSKLDSIIYNLAK